MLFGIGGFLDGLVFLLCAPFLMKNSKRSQDEHFFSLARNFPWSRYSSGSLLVQYIKRYLTIFFQLESFDKNDDGEIELSEMAK